MYVLFALDLNKLYLNWNLNLRVTCSLVTFYKVIDIEIICLHKVASAIKSS